jgi:hypothetical protein
MRYMKLLSALAVLIAGPSIATAQVATYSFSGKVTGASPPGVVPIGAPVSGTLVFNFANAVPSQSAGILGTSFFTAQAYGGPAYNVPFPSGYVFSATAKAGAVSYSSKSFDSSYYYAQSDFEDDDGNFISSQSAADVTEVSQGFDFYLVTSDHSHPYLDNGLPVLTSVTTGSGDMNPSPAGVQYTIDKLTLVSGPPGSLATVTGAQGAGNWYVGTPTTLKWTVLGAPDPVKSGCDTVKIPETKGTTYTCSATNSLGNDSNSIFIQRDTVPPTVTIKKPTINAVYALNSKELASYSCADAISGVASCAGPVANGAAISTAITGPQLFNVTGVDVAGNTFTKSVSYTVEPPTATPELSLKAGTYTGAQSVTIKDTTANAVIYYTLDGTAPTTSSATYSGTAIGITSTETLKADAIAPGFTRSAVRSASYTIQ